MRTSPVTVILPTYLEAQNLPTLIPRIHRAVSPQEILVIDDDSPDDTKQVVAALKKRYPSVALHSQVPPLGLAASIRYGIARAKSPIIAWMDADGSHPPELLPSLYEAMASADITVASWHIPGGEDKRSETKTRFFSGSINLLARLVLGSTIHSYTSGYCMGKADILRRLRMRGSYGEYFIDMCAQILNERRTVTEIPFVLTSRTAGKSKTASGIFSYCLRGIPYLVTVARSKAAKLQKNK